MEDAGFAELAEGDGAGGVEALVVDPDLDLVEVAGGHFGGKSGYGVSLVQARYDFMGVAVLLPRSAANDLQLGCCIVESTWLAVNPSDRQSLVIVVSPPCVSQTTMLRRKCDTQEKRHADSLSRSLSDWVERALRSDCAAASGCAVNLQILHAMLAVDNLIGRLTTVERSRCFRVLLLTLMTSS